MAPSINLSHNRRRHRFNPFSDVSVPERFDVQVAILQFELLYSRLYIRFPAMYQKRSVYFHNRTI